MKGRRKSTFVAMLAARRRSMDENFPSVVGWMVKSDRVSIVYPVKEKDYTSICLKVVTSALTYQEGLVCSHTTKTVV
jgi:hypothetical protein